MSTKLIKLTKIVTTAGTQVRSAIDESTVAQYAEAMHDASNKFPPVVVFHDSKQFILADGFHRVMAATRNGFTDIEADIQKGTKADALKFALSANAAHGLRRSNADKRHAVELALAEWPKISDREIARICAVSPNFVSEHRRQLSSDDSSTRIGADGKERKLPNKPVKAAEPEQPKALSGGAPATPCPTEAREAQSERPAQPIEAAFCEKEQERLATPAEDESRIQFVIRSLKKIAEELEEFEAGMLPTDAPPDFDELGNQCFIVARWLHVIAKKQSK